MYIPTALSSREDEALRRWAKDKVVTEAGALLGHSTIQLASTARSVISIDRHTGYNNNNDTFRAFMRNVSVAGVNKRVTPVIGDASLLRNYPSDFCFIDLCGTKNGSLNGLLSARSPVVSIHDFQRQNCAGVAKAVEESGYKVIERVDSLIILER